MYRRRTRFARRPHEPRKYSRIFRQHPDYEIVLEIDSREKKKLIPPKVLYFTPAYGKEPLLLRVGYKVMRLPFGDYAIQGCRNITCWDRKFSVSELDNNLQSRESHKQADRFRRLVKGCAYPFVYLDMRWTDAYPNRYEGNAVHTVWDALFRWQAKYGFQIAGPVSGRSTYTRKKSCEHMIRWMLGIIFHHCRENRIDVGTLIE